MTDTYLDSIEQHSRECREDLDALSEIAGLRPLSRIERRAAERVLQVLLESCIGAAKFWLKAEHKTLPLDACDSIAQLAELQKISSDELKQWYKFIGLRDALVRDYPMIDSDLLHALLADRAYYFLIDFIIKVRQQLAANPKN